MSASGASIGPDLPPVNDETIRESEERAFRAWPAESVNRLSGWTLRHSNGSSTRRTNSVFAGPVDASINLDALLGQVESFYGNIGQPSRFQLTPVSSPADLDDHLAKRGYASEGMTTVSWALRDEVASNCGDPLDNVFFSSTLTDDWAKLYVQSIHPGDDPAARLALFDRIRGDKAFVSVVHDDGPAAIGLGVFDGGWTGVFAMYTVPGYRRRGYAFGLMEALAEWTGVIGGNHMYLQVEDDNDAARSVYDRCGFRPAYQYHYRTLSE